MINDIWRPDERVVEVKRGGGLEQDGQVLLGVVWTSVGVLCVVDDVCGTL